MTTSRRQPPVGAAAAPGAAPAPPAPRTAAAAANVAQAVAGMASAVQRGEFWEAEAAGRLAPINLAIPRAAIR